MNTEHTAETLLAEAERYVDIAMEHLRQGTPVRGKKNTACASRESLRIHFLFPVIKRETETWRDFLKAFMARAALTIWERHDMEIRGDDEAVFEGLKAEMRADIDAFRLKHVRDIFTPMQRKILRKLFGSWP